MDQSPKGIKERLIIAISRMSEEEAQHILQKVLASKGEPGPARPLASGRTTAGRHKAKHPGLTHYLSPDPLTRSCTVFLRFQDHLQDVFGFPFTHRLNQPIKAGLAFAERIFTVQDGAVGDAQNLAHLLQVLPAQGVGFPAKELSQGVDAQAGGF